MAVHDKTKYANVMITIGPGKKDDKIEFAKLQAE